MTNSKNKKTNKIITKFDKENFFLFKNIFQKM